MGVVETKGPVASGPLEVREPAVLGRLCHQISTRRDDSIGIDDPLPSRSLRSRSDLPRRRFATCGRGVAVARSPSFVLKRGAVLAGCRSRLALFATAALRGSGPFRP